MDGPASWFDKMPFIPHPERVAANPPLRVDVKESRTDQAELRVENSAFYEVYLVADGLSGDAVPGLRVH